MSWRALSCRISRGVIAQQQRSGRATRLNDKTVTLLCGSKQWRVAYCFLHRVVDSADVEQNVPELDVIPADKNEPA